jgi:hypothetical protein
MALIKLAVVKHIIILYFNNFTEITISMFLSCHDPTPR